MISKRYRIYIAIACKLHKETVQIGLHCTKARATAKRSLWAVSKDRGWCPPGWEQLCRKGPEGLGRHELSAGQRCAPAAKQQQCPGLFSWGHPQDIKGRSYSPLLSNYEISSRKLFLILGMWMHINNRQRVQWLGAIVRAEEPEFVSLENRRCWRDLAAVFQYLQGGH